MAAIGAEELGRDEPAALDAEAALVDLRAQEARIEEVLEAAIDGLAALAAAAKKTPDEEQQHAAGAEHAMILGERGAGVVELAGGAIRGVALGVGVTAVVQSLLAGGGLWLAGMPFAGLLTALMFMLCIAQVGPLPVLVPAALWVLFGQGDTGWGVFLLVWSAFVGTIDNFIRPVLIRLGADLPLLLIFIGVIGGLFAFGLVGIFVGPVVLAVAWTLLEAWLGEGDSPAASLLAPAPEPAPASATASALEAALAQGGREAPTAAVEAVPVPGPAPAAGPVALHAPGAAPGGPAA
jgi:hypothetical protein